MARPTTSSTDRLAEEYRALRDAAAVVDLAAWTVLEILGAETRSFLQGVATQDFETPPPVGSAVCTLFLTEKGRAAAHAWVTFGEGKDPVTAWILSDPGCREDLRTHLERYRVMEDVEFRGPEGTPRLLGIIGPERDPLAGAIVSSIRGASAVHAESISFVLAPPDTDPKALPPTVDPRAFDAWRIRIGLPYRGIDFGDDRIATELALPDAISMTKGCYVGQEVVARTSHRGKLRRQRIGFRFPWSGQPLPAGTPLRSGGLECGNVTSTVWEPGTQEGVGMGYITPEALAANLDVIAVQGEKSTLLSPHSWPL